MAQIVPNPPPKNYRNKSISNFVVPVSDGVAHFQVWGLPHDATDGEFQIGRRNLGTHGVENLVCDISAGAYVDLKRFIVRGLIENDVVTVYRETNFEHNKTAAEADKWPPNWVPHANWVTVKNSLDTSAKKLAEGKLEVYSGNPKISFYPYGSRQRVPPVKEADWQKSVQDVLDKICLNELGTQIVQMINAPTLIHPWVPSYANATSEVAFTPDVHTDKFAAGASPHEISVSRVHPQARAGARAF